MNKTELCFITATNLSTRTFFAQLCKNSNEDLVKFNLAIGAYCQKVLTNQLERIIKSARKGDIVCARYAKNDSWFRAMVLSYDKTTRAYVVFFTDFGDVETLSSENIIQPDVENLPEIKRAPFGISCFLENSEHYNVKQTEHLLDCLYDNYVMVKVLERQTKLQWKVGIPKHAYNIPFWLIFKPDKFANESDAGSGQVGDGQKTGGGDQAAVVV